MEGKASRVAELQYLKRGDGGSVELIVPVGTPSKELGRLSDLLAGGLLARLPRGCQACISGDNLIIRERFDDILRIDLDRMEVLDH